MSRLLMTLLTAAAFCGCGQPPPHPDGLVCKDGVCFIPEPPPAKTWAEYTTHYPRRRYLSPDADHPFWKGRGQVCGAGKCD